MIPARVERAQCKLNASPLLQCQGRRGSFVMKQLRAERLERIDPCRPMLVQRPPGCRGAGAGFFASSTSNAPVARRTYIQAVLCSDDGQII